MVRRGTDAWGEDDVRSIPGQTEERADSGGPSGLRDANALPLPRSVSRLLPGILVPAAGAIPPAGAVPPLRALVLGFLGRHVDSLVSQLGPRLAILPADVKACLLCVARRRGMLSNRVLLALADDGWTLMDLAGATVLTERALRQALMRCPHLRALDITGISSTSPTLLRTLPDLCPSLELLAVGGCKAQEAAMLEVLPDLIPHVRVREQPHDAVQESWEDVVSEAGAPIPDPGIHCGLQRLKLIVWPSPPPLVLHIVRTVNPRVIVIESLPPHAQGAYGSTIDNMNSGNGPQPLLPLLQAAREDAVGSPCGNGISRRVKLPGFAAAESSRSGSKPGIQVIRVRKPSTEASPSPLYVAAKSRSHPHHGEHGGGSRGGRYLAPHLRQQRQQDQQQQLPAAEHGGADSLAAEASGGSQTGGPVSPPPLQLPLQQHQRLEDHYHCRQQKQHDPQSDASQQSGSGRRQLDDGLAALVAGEAWEGLGSSSGERKEEELHIAEKFRRAYEEQDARLRAKAAREAAAAMRYELRSSGVARALAQWLDQE
ncbi:hypothetical protein Vretimale_18503 [Volvox reticuliferus]|uniref:Uncharacterized protein n=1 Tax=Volvox reticuliferus TaxID=1737510 RepID=A0A8J4FYM8_9CHLO|nr:hypothetical protein Vretifemale_19660 [Volvox reticuliferus]GIM15834.1 hypothetical protein Vretimale_18503 [Volvox reticuliferus]